MENDPQSNSKEKGSSSPVFGYSPPSRQPGPEHSISYWLKKFLACNPFYLVSAALLLYGVYLVSFDANFLSREISQLAFNFSSLQIYEGLLVGTAIVLARRRIWYDSVLLIGLENLLLLVPFMLISQAALLSQTAPLSQRIVLAICLAGAAAVLLRFWSLKHFFKDLNLPRRALVCGLMLLIVNVVLPLVYRHLHDSKFGTKPTEGAAYELNRYSWLLLVPAMIALVNLLPRPRASGALLPQRRSLPLFLFALWLAGSVTHIYSLSYVYNFDWEFIFILPLLWVVLWSVYLRHGDFFTVPSLSRILLAPPLAVAAIALPRIDHSVFFSLMAVNLAGYLIVFLKDRNNLTAFHLLLLSGAMLVAGFIKPMEPGLPLDIRSGKWLLACTTAYVLYWIIRSRNPKTGLAGMLITGVAVFNLVSSPELGFGVAIQSALVFLLLHSLRWTDADHQGARGARILASALLFLHALMMVHWHWRGANPVVFGAGGLLLAASLLKRLFMAEWRPAIVPITAALMLLIAPGEFTAGKLEATSSGLLAVLGSFLLFGVGTLVALTKSRWNAPATPATIESGPIRQAHEPL